MFWPRLKTIEQTADRTVLRERPMYLSSVIPFAAALTPFAVLIADHDLRSPGAIGFVIPLCASILFFGVGLTALVDSTFCIDRVAGKLRIKRKVLWWSREKEYSVHDVMTIFPERTIKGNWLRMQLRSGGTCRFSFYAVYAPLEADAGMVNALLHDARQSGAQASAGNPFVH
jgi:hypothetical protein